MSREDRYKEAVFRERHALTVREQRAFKEDVNYQRKDYKHYSTEEIKQLKRTAIFALLTALFSAVFATYTFGKGTLLCLISFILASLFFLYHLVWKPYKSKILANYKEYEWQIECVKLAEERKQDDIRLQKAHEDRIKQENERLQKTVDLIIERIFEDPRVSAILHNLNINLEGYK